jgi:hypothetical protein
VASFKLQMVLRFSIQHIEYLFDGLGRVNFFPDFVEGIFHLWRYDDESGGFQEIEWNKEMNDENAPNTSSGD